MFLWPWDLMQPVRSYFARRRSRWKQNWSKGTCPSCKLPFDNGRKRCVVDSCGHDRCYNCLCVQDTCPVCIRDTVVYRKTNKVSRRAHRVEKRKSNENARHTLLDISNELSLSIPKETAYSGVYQKGVKRSSYSLNEAEEYSFDKLFSSMPECFMSLKPLYFEVPQPENENEFLYREWVFQEISKVLTSNSRGVALVGDEGSGKTTLILQLVDWSCFGRKRKSGLINEGMLSDVRIFSNLASKVVGYHFCQSDCSETCLIPNFVHSLAAQLCQAPQLAEYRKYLVHDVSCQQMLTLESCINDPDTALRKGILNPLCSLNSLPLTSELIVIDNIHEVEGQQRSIVSFLTTHIEEFPAWLKIILSIKMVDVNKICFLPFQRINLDSSELKVQEDLFRYARSRISKSEVIQTNICSFGDEGQISRLVDHLVTGGQASFLFMRLILDLFQQNYLVIKSNTFNVIPISLDEVFTLSFSLKFPSTLTFNKVKPILEICLASQTPLTALEIFYTLESASVIPELKWIDFTQTLHSLYGILIQRRDESLMISHPALRNWLKKNKKFLCDVELGHTYLSLLPTRINLPLSKEKELEFLNHLSLSTLFKDEKLLKAYWLQYSSLDISRIFIQPRLIFWTDLKVMRLLLESGADANSKLSNSKQSPAINEASKVGNAELVKLLVEFKVLVDTSDIFGVTPLIEAAIHGHYKVIEVLVDAGAKVHLQDKVGRCALSCASEKGYLDVVKFVHQANLWPSKLMHSNATQRALVAASGAGKLPILEYIAQTMNTTGSNSILNQLKSTTTHDTMDVCKIFLNSNNSDSQSFWLSAFRGHIPTLRILLDKGIDVNIRDEFGRSGLIWACINNQKNTARFLLEKGADIEMKDQQQCMPIHFAAQYGDAEMIQMLLKYSANPEIMNNDNDTALECAIKARNFSTAIELLKYDVKIGDKAFKYAENEQHLYCSLLCKLLSEGVNLTKTGKFKEAIQRFEYGSSKCSPENSQRLVFQFQNHIELCNKMLDKKVPMLTTVREDFCIE